MRFTISKSFDIGQKKLDAKKVREEFYLFLTSYCKRCETSRNRFNGSLKDFFENGTLEVFANFSIKKQRLFIEIKGNSRLSGFSIFALVTFAILSTFSLGKIMGAIFLFNLITFFLSRKLPRKYCEEAIESLMFKIEQSPSLFMPSPVPPSNEKAETKSLPPPLPVAVEAESQ